MYILSNIENSFESYQQLISFYQAYKDKLFDTVKVELRQWFSANMSSALGAVFDKFTGHFNEVDFDYIDPQIETILLKNNFLSYFGRKQTIDVHNTTIKFQKLQPKDGKYFKKYVIEEFIEGHNSDLPEMSKAVKEKIIEAICEIFVNAQIHSTTEFIYTAGQFFPRKNKIEFTIVDTGIGFREKVNRRFDSSLSAVQALRWAVQDKKTTKEGISGGIGLAILREFITANKGKMQIVSNDGFYQYSAGQEILKMFVGEFPGTIVNLQFRTDDNHNYAISSEIDINDIF